MLDDSRLRRNQGYARSRMLPLDDILHQHVGTSEIHEVIYPDTLGKVSLDAGDMFAIRNGQLNQLGQVELAGRIARSQALYRDSQPSHVDRHHAAVDFGWTPAEL